MSANYREDRILAKASEFQPGDVDRLNKILEDAGHGRPLRQPETDASACGASGLVALTVTGADPKAIRNAVDAHARRGGEESPTLVLDHQFSSGTAEQAQQDVLVASGLKSGHGTAAWLSAPDYEMPEQELVPWQRLDRRPVIALLDSGVQPHVWLPLPANGQACVVDAAEAYGWPAPKLPEDTGPIDGNYGGRWGHATFIAGLIRLAAPDAQILSMKVMSSVGQVTTCDVNHALTWLVEHPEVGGSVDIVLMCFGRQTDADDSDLTSLRDPIDALSPRVRFVASAGNDGSENPVYPAAFAAEPGSTVVSVGGLASPTERAPGSNYGPWVQEWRKSSNLVSIMPLTTKETGVIERDPKLGFGPFRQVDTRDGFAWWSGTSFAAAIYAGELAALLPQPGPALPEPAAGP
jgi:subtilisin family serine protease